MSPDWLAPRRRRSIPSDAVVTGAGSGIGRSFSMELSRRGGRVVCADRNADTAKESADEITRRGGHALAVACDVSSLDDVASLADQAEEWLDGPVSLVVNNAGIGAGGQPLTNSRVDDWHRTLDVNLWGVIHGCHVFAPRLQAAGRGGIINVASVASFGSLPRMGAYNVSKAGVLALSETLSAELSGTGVTVTVVCPSFVKTNIMATDAIDASAAKFAARLMQLTGSSPESVALAALEAHARGQLYVLPHLDGRLLWRLKRLSPSLYTQAMGLADRFARSPAV